jgi:hypothetical protein
MTVFLVEVTIPSESCEVSVGLLKRKGDVSWLSGWHDIGHHDFIPANAALNEETYKEASAYLQEVIQLKHHKMRVARGWVLLHSDCCLWSSSLPSMVLWCLLTHCTMSFLCLSIDEGLSPEWCGRGLSDIKWVCHVAGGCMWFFQKWFEDVYKCVADEWQYFEGIWI